MLCLEPVCKNTQLTALGVSDCVLRDLLSFLTRKDKFWITFLYVLILVSGMQWKPGDFIITDNLAVAHEASPQTQMAVKDVGLRVMHRTTIAGQHHLHK